MTDPTIMVGFFMALTSYNTKEFPFSSIHFQKRCTFAIDIIFIYCFMKFFRTLLMLWLIPLCVSAQNKTQVLADFRWTLAEFQSALNFMVEEPDFIQQNIRNIADAFGSDEYFFYNSNKQPSFHEWLHGYYRTWQPDKAVVHTFNIREQSLAKMEPDRSEDHRWRFDADLSRTVGDGPEQKMLLSFIVQWGGEGHYAPILQIDGDLFFKHKPAPVITTDGLRLLLISSYDYIGPFQEWKEYKHVFEPTRIAVVRKNGKYGFIRNDNKVLVQPCYDEVGCKGTDVKSDNDQCTWSDGILLMSVKKDGKWGYVNTDGREVVPTQYDYVQHTMDADAKPVVVKQGFKYGYIDKDGNAVTSLKYQYAYEYFLDENVAKVNLNGKYGLINKQGKEILPIEYDEIGYFNNGRGYVLKDKKVGIVNENGEILVPLNYDALYSKTEKKYELGHGMTFWGPTAFLLKDGKYALVDREGRILSDFKYDKIYSVSSVGKHEVHLNGETVYLDRMGNEFTSKDQLEAKSDSIMARQGDLVAQFDYAVRLCGQKKYADAMPRLQKALDAKILSAAYYIGECYYYGYDIFNGNRYQNNRNVFYEKALEYYRLATQGEDYIKYSNYVGYVIKQNAMYSLGWMYEHGQGVSKNIIEAIQWYEKAGDFSDAKDRVTSLQKEYNNGHEYVDLGLSVKWATCNVGATSPENLGDRFRWGETEPGNIGNKKSSRTYKEKYPSSIGKYSLYNAANDKMGGEWRLPTVAEMNELMEKCTWERTLLNKTLCVKITGPNGNSIYIPGMDGTHDIHYWSANAFDKKEASYLCVNHLFDNLRKLIDTKYKYFGAYIRAVID